MQSNAKKAKKKADKKLERAFRKAFFPETLAQEKAPEYPGIMANASELYLRNFRPVSGVCSRKMQYAQIYK